MVIEQIQSAMAIASSIILLVWSALFVAVAPSFPAPRDRAILFTLAAFAFVGGIL